jgi:hypothetical protein
MTSHLKMATIQVKAMCVLRFLETESVTKTQRRYRTQYGRAPPSDNAIRRWLEQFQETGSVLHRKGGGSPGNSQGDVDRFQDALSSYVPIKARMLKLFSILQYSFYK